MKNWIALLLVVGILSLSGCITPPPPTPVPPTPVPPTPVPQPLSTSYTIKVKTSCIDYAGTDADVVISVYGSSGTIGDFFLDTNEDNFEKCKVDTFTYGEIPDIGTVDTVEIGHDNSGGDSGWHLEYVNIKNNRTGDEWRFNCNCWLADDEGDGQLSRTLYASR